MLLSTLLIAIQMTLSAPMAQAQDSAPGASANERRPAGRGRPGTRGGGAPAAVEDVRIFALKFGEPHEIADLINSLMREKYAHADGRTNSILFSGPKACAAGVERLIAQLDVPGAETEARDQTIVLPLKHRGAKEVAKQLSLTYQRVSGFTIAPDEARNRIILRGKRDRLDQSIKVIENIDIAPANANVEFSFFKAELETDEPIPPIPDDLKPVAAELKRFGHIRLLGRLATVAVQEQDFQISGRIANNISARVVGSLLNGINDGTIRIQLMADMSLNRADAKAQPEFKLTTTVSTREGDYVVLGIAPSGWEPGESAILVMHVTKPTTR